MPELEDDPSYTPTELPDEPVGVWGCTVRQVGALARNVTITAQPTEDRDPDWSITITEVEGWIEQLSATLTARLTAFHRIRPGDTRTALLTAGADAIANAAASYAVAAAHPEDAAPADAVSYAALLWQRWETAVDALDTALKSLIAEAGPDVAPELRGTPAWSSPPPALPDNMRW